MHPAMLIYLDNCAVDRAELARRDSASGKGLNENLGRELMELYTLGVDGGYTQADVIAMAKMLTGWSARSRRPTTASAFIAEPP